MYERIFFRLDRFLIRLRQTLESKHGGFIARKIRHLLIMMGIMTDISIDI